MSCGGWLRVSALWALAFGLTLISGCASLWPAVPPARLAGRLLNANAGEPVADSQLTLIGLTTGYRATTRSDAAGRFSLSLKPDRYQIEAQKPDYAGSRVVGLEVRQHTEITILQQKSFNPQWSVTPPEIELKGVADGDRVAGNIYYEVTAQGPNDISVIYAALGKTPGAALLTAPRQAFFGTPATGEQILDPTLFGVHGQTTFEVVVYDVNNNRTHLIRSIEILPPGGELSPPTNLQALAVTVGKQVAFLGKPLLIPLGSGPPLVIAAAPPKANLFVQLRFTPSTRKGLTGYRIYRSFDGKNFAPIGTIPPQRTSFSDASPLLSVGRPVYYYMRSFLGGDEGPPTPTVMTVPLRPFEVRLISPQDGATGVSRSPSFRWKPVPRVGKIQRYAVILRDSVLGDVSWWVGPVPPQEFIENDSEIAWNEDGRFDGTPWETLQPYRLYEWEVAYAVALDEAQKPTAVSIAIDRFQWQTGLPTIGVSATDHFSFTTGE